MHKLPATPSFPLSEPLQSCLISRSVQKILRLRLQTLILQSKTFMVFMCSRVTTVEWKMSRFIALSALCVYLIKNCSHASSDATLPAVHISPRYIELPGSRVISLLAGEIHWLRHCLNETQISALSRSPNQGPLIDEAIKATIITAAS